MANPLENREFRHYLNFMSDDTGRIEITEPVKFDASEFIIEQDNYARHISFMNEEVSLEFYDVFTTETDPYQLLNGTVVSQLSHCLDYLLYYNKRYGFQSKIQYILERNGLEFIVGELNFEGSKTDELTYFFCKVVQNTKRATVIRREDTKIDAFATENIDGDSITPIETTNVLLRSKPIVKTSLAEASQYDYQTQFFGSQTIAIFPIFKIQKKFGINTTLVPFNQVYQFPLATGGEPFLVETRDNISFIKAKESLTNIVVNIKDLNIQSNFSGIEQIVKRLTVSYGESYTTGEFETIVLESSSDDSVSIINQDYTVNIPSINVGGFIFIQYSIFDPYTLPTTTPSSSGGISISGGELSVTASSAAIDTVIKASRYVDLIKQSLKSINGMTLNAPRFDEGGEFYDLFATTGNLIRQRDDVPFYIDFKDRRENLALVNGDIQINENDAFALQYEDFYADVDNGVFNLATSQSFESNYNSDYVVNLFEFNFKNYEKDRDEQNTIDVVHGKTQWIPNNDKVKATKKVEIKDTFDPFAIQAQVSQVFKETTALDGDEKIFGLDCVNLSPSEKGGFISLMTHQVTGLGKVKLLKDSNLPSWALLGFNVDSSFDIVSGENIGTYIVHEIENTIITLTPQNPFSQSFNGEKITEVSYPFDNVSWVNRTNEGFTIIENLLSPDKFSNLKYAVRNCMVHWEQVLSTYALYLSENIKNSEFLNNGLMRTQFGDEEIYVQNGDIVLSDIKPPLLTPKEYVVDLVAGYDEVISLIAKYENINTVGGFIRVQDTNGRIKKLYPKKLGYTWATKVLKIVGEERYEDDKVIITKSGTTLFINRVGYEQESLSEIFYESNGDFIVLFDENNVNLINFTKYDKFIVQEETFENAVDLIQAIIDL